MQGLVVDGQTPLPDFQVSLETLEQKADCGCVTGCLCASAASTLLKTPREGLRAAGQSTLTDAAGRFTLCGVGDPIPALWAEHADGRVAVPTNEPRLDTPVTLQLVHLEHIDGVVLDAVEGPVAAQVTLFPEHGVSSQTVETRDGRFVAQLPRGQVRALVETLKRAPVIVEANVTIGSLLVLRLDRPSALVVRVLENERPVPGATVTLEGERAVTSNELGEARFENLAHEAVKDLRATKGTTLASAAVRLRAGQTQHLDVSLEPAVRLRGVIVDEKGATRLGKVRLGGELFDTDATGHFVSPLLPRDDDATATPVVERCDAESATRVTLGSDDVDVVLKVRCEVTVRGVVLDANGQPVADALVRGSTQDTSESTPTNGQGQFELHLPAGTARFNVTHARYRDLEQPFVVPALEVTLVLDAGGSISGKVVDQRGQPLSGVDVQPIPGVIEDLFNEHDTRSSTVTAVDGRFEVTGLLAGRWVLAASRLGVPPTPSAAIVLEPGQHREDITITIDAPVDVRGVVRDAERRPIVGARVSCDTVGDAEMSLAITDVALGSVDGIVRLMPSETSTDSEGRFELRGVSRRTVQLDFAAPGFRTASQVVARGANVEVTLVRTAGRIRGRVVTETGAVVTRFVVNGGAVSAADGRFELDVPEKDYHLLVEGPGFVATSRIVEFSASEHDVGDVVLKRGRSLDVIVTSTEGKPLEGVRVAFGQLETEAVSCRTNPKGTCRLSPLADLDGQLKAMKDGFVPGEAKLEKARLAAPFALALEAAGGRAEGLVFARPGKPAGALSVFIETDQTTHFALTDTTGHFSAAAIPEGFACASVELSGLFGVGWATPFTSSKAPEPLVVGPGVGGARVTRRASTPGRLVALKGTHELEGFDLGTSASTLCQKKKTAAVTVVVVGSLELDGLSPGTWSLFFIPLEHQSTVRPPVIFEATPGSTRQLD